MPSPSVRISVAYDDDAAAAAEALLVVLRRPPPGTELESECDSEDEDAA